MPSAFRPDTQQGASGDPDPTDLATRATTTAPDGLLTAEEVWNEIGWPVYEDATSQQYTPIDAIEATITRVLRQYEDQAIAQIERSDQAGRLARVSEEHRLSVQQGGEGLSTVGQTRVPQSHLPYFFGKVVAGDGTPLAPSSDVSRDAHVSPSMFDDYRYERAGRMVLVAPSTLSAVHVWLVPEAAAIETALEEIVPEINQEILDAARQALERRAEGARQIKTESRGDSL
jgi:hypothetical protein